MGYMKTFFCHSGFSERRMPESLMGISLQNINKKGAVPKGQPLFCYKITTHCKTKPDQKYSF